jgi:hypothetical protein
VEVDNEEAVRHYVLKSRNTGFVEVGVVADDFRRLLV